jgi:hypothetical protein
MNPLFAKVPEMAGTDTPRLPQLGRLVTQFDGRIPSEKMVKKESHG